MTTHSTASASLQRPRTDVDRLADEYFDRELALSPLAMTALGIDERQDELDDLSPAGLDAHDALARSTLNALDRATPCDAVDAVTIAAMRDRLGLMTEQHATAEDKASVNNIASGLHSVREGFDAMPTDTPAQWETIAARLRAVPLALQGWFTSQLAAVDAGLRPASRQIAQLSDQVDRWVAPAGYFEQLVAQARLRDGQVLPREVAEHLDEAADIAAAAYRAAAERLRTQLSAVATPEDAVGPERYRLASREFLGTTIDLEATYRWGLEQVAEITAREQELADRIRPGAGVPEALAALDADERYRIHGIDALRTWMQRTADGAIAALDHTHFDIPEPVRTIECCIAPTSDGGIYYTPPSDDFSRPGRMWWSVPEGTTDFSTWRELTTVHHEGVPGHHLQCAQAIYRKDLLNNWRRNGCWVSGHGEGWALYAEQLMAELGFLDDPGDLLGMLDSQALRCVRVVLDIGLHCGLEAPAQAGGGQWTFDKAWRYFNAHVSMDEGFARFEVNRYFGWPGQAASYRLGQQAWLDLREAVRQQDGEGFDLKALHARVLDLGSLPLDVLRQAVAG
ncbi:Uncharacterized conserved protein, DUF885 familyt [Propionibacterium cyclohexanicum]|uniref:Uncharacterized conserved protein, DUF885 familyt n=1 Tax=Propionibacterium cyclohexanicum TaxID=64702 RepID=A0A1H9R1W4_9ACTN|nr:DUF885 domain-containing protein [Propionibacterium cyclohexanicum]SER66505.1 Uncharacterized conserved protein, DUF885 familyt [Propionibacterium cyclohexanicum]